MSSDGAPAPAGPYAPFVRAGSLVACSGQIGLRNGAIVSGGVADELECAIDNLEAVLASSRAALVDVVKTTLFYVDAADFASLNEVYAARFGDHRPARSAVVVAALPLGARVEIEAWAYVGADR